MKKFIFNEEKISDNEINEIVTRVKVFIKNSNNEILLAHSGGGPQLPGGHVENGETYEAAVIREVLEETGIELNLDTIKPFMERDYYKKNYKNTGKNRISKIIYYTAFSDNKPNETRMNLTVHEKENNFSLQYVHMDNFEEFVKNYDIKENQDSNKVIAGEILQAFAEAKKYL